MHTLVVNADRAEHLLMTQNWIFAGTLPNNKVVLLHKTSNASNASENGPEPRVGVGPQEFDPGPGSSP